ncbi:MAG: MlaD family protein [Pseudomonadota bacterium]
MSDPTSRDGSSDIPDAQLQPAERSLMERASVVWLVPVGALLLALGIAWQVYSDRGPIIEITFANGSGIAVGETELRYRDIGVGQVERVGFTPGLDRVLVTVRLDEEVAPYIDGDAEFWVVRPEVTAQGVEGLSTVLSGVYIEGSWNGEQGTFVDRHVGLDETPVARPDQPGTRLVLRTESGRGLTTGAPILYRGLEVGRVGTPRIASDGISVLADAFIFAPHDTRLTDRTRFWTVSGFSFEIGAQGASLNFESLASLVRGGLSFDTVVSGGAPIVPGALFDIYEDEDTALASLFAESDVDVPRLNVTAVFEDNVAGLSTGADVELRGFPIGEVLDLTGQVDAERFGDDRVRLVATLSIRLDQIAMGGAGDDREAVLDFLTSRVEEGLRARLTNASLLTGGLKVELVEVEDATPAAFERDAVPFPVLPTAPAQVQDVAGAAQGLIARVNNLPVEEVLDNTNAFLRAARNLVEDGNIQRASGEVVGLVEDVRAVVGSEELQALPGRLATAIEGLDVTFDEARAVLADVRAQGTVAQLTEAITAAGAAATEIGTAVEGVPALVDRINTVVAQAEGLALADLVGQANGLLEEARVVLGAEATQALPQQLGTALEGLAATIEVARGVVAQLETDDTVGALTQALASTSAAADSVGAAVADIPPLIERMDTVVAQVEALALDELVDETNALFSDARAIVDTDEARAIPANVNAALDEVTRTLAEARAIFEELEQQQSVTLLSEALDATSEAADDVSEAVADVPALVQRIDAVAARVETLEVEALLEEIAGLAGAARAVLDTDGARALPERVGTALAEVEAAVAELRAGGTVENVNETLASARRAADSVADTVDGLPDLVAQVDTVLREAEAALASLGESGTLNREAQSALRNVSRAADAIRSLARAIERQPNSLLTGR